MSSKVGYFARETLVSLRRNLLMTVAGILTVTVSLALFGGIFLLSRVVDHGTAKWKNGIEEEIFMNVDATQDQIGAVQERLNSDRDVKRYVFLSKEDALREAKRLFKGQSDLFASVTAADLPASFRVAPRKPELTETVADRFKNLPGVDTVQTALATTKSVLAFTRILRLVFVGLALVLIVSALFLIVNTIRLATFARRREIEVMKLVGASNWFVRIPFMAEGLVQGVIGAGFAVGLVYLLRIGLGHLLDHPSHLKLLQGWYVTSGDAAGIGLVVLLLGGLIGLIGSTIGLYRFLRV